MFPESSVSLLTPELAKGRKLGFVVITSGSSGRPKSVDRITNVGRNRAAAIDFDLKKRVVGRSGKRCIILPHPWTTAKTSNIQYVNPQLRTTSAGSKSLVKEQNVVGFIA